MKTLLITRELTADSPLRSLESESMKVIGKSFIRFEEVPFDDWNHSADWVFFYSKHGVKYSLKNTEFLRFCKTVKIATYGRMTAHYIKQHYELTPDYVGDGDRVNTLNQYLEYNPSHTLYVQGSKSLRALQSDPQYQSPYSELISYQSMEQSQLLSTVPDLLVFTSPLNVQSYLRQYPLQSSQSIWAIGKTTGYALQQVTSQQISIASRPSMEVLTDEITQHLRERT